MSLLALYENLKHRVVDSDLTKVSDDELRAMYDECFRAIPYYNSMQMTVKLEANSVYGACGNQYFRFYNVEVAADITTEGKLMLFEVDQIVNTYYANWKADYAMHKILVEKFGIESFSGQKFEHEFPDGSKMTLPVFKNSTLDMCVYGDTDSRYIDYGNIFELAGFSPKNNETAVDFILLMHKNRIERIIKHGIQKYISIRNGENFLIMELEVICGKAYFLAKKKYVMSLLWKDGKYIAKEGKMKAVGVELIQGSTSNFIKDSMKFVLNRLLSPKSDMSQIFKIGMALTKKAELQPIEDLAKINGINKYEEYVADDVNDVVFQPGAKSIPATVRAAATYNHLLQKSGMQNRYPRIFKGNRIHWYYTKDQKYPVFAWPVGEDPPPFAPEMNHMIQIEKLIIVPLKRFISGDEYAAADFGKSVVQPTLQQLLRKR